MTDTNQGEHTNRPPVIDRHLPPAEPKRDGPLGTISGVDRAALGLEHEPISASPNAQVDATHGQVPGPEYGDSPATAAKPWQTSFATRDDQAGIGAEPDPEGKV